MLIAMGSMVIFNITDTYFIGRLGKDRLAALTFTFPVVLFLGSISMGIGIGASAVISRAIGRENYRDVVAFTSSSLLLGLLISGGTILLGLSTIDPLFRLLGAKGILLEYIKSYMIIWYPGFLFILIPMIGNAALRATGDTRTPGTIMFTAAILNILLDPLFIFGSGPVPGFGIQGAALATLISRGLTMIAALYFLHFREGMISFQSLNRGEVFRSFREVLVIGIPASLSRILLPLGGAVVTRMIASFGVSAVAAYGIGHRLEFIALAPLMALSSVLGPFVGQNFGGKRRGRVVEALRISFAFSMIWGILMWAVYSFFAGSIITLFNRDPGIAEPGTLFFLLVPTGFAYHGILFLSNNVLNVLGAPYRAMGFTAIQIFVVFLPVAWLLSSWIGLAGIFLAYPASYLFTGSLAYRSAWRRIDQIVEEGKPAPVLAVREESLTEI